MDKIVSYYNQFDEWGRLDREPLEFRINLHHILECLPGKGQVLDNGAGPGKYAMALAEMGYRVTLTDLTPRLVEIAERKAEELKLRDRFDGFHACDARELGRFADGQFDASLMLGPLYHLQAAEDRDKAARELYRVTKPDGFVFVAFMPRVKFLSTSLMFPENWKPNHTVDGLAEFMRTGKFNHSAEGRFTGAYYYPIEEIKPFMESHGFKTVKMIGSGSVAGAMKDEHWAYWRGRGEAEFKQVMDLILKESDNPYNLGASTHLLYIGRKA